MLLGTCSRLLGKNMTQNSSDAPSLPPVEAQRLRAETLYEQIGGDLCMCQRAEVSYWCERCQQRIQLIREALQAEAAIESFTSPDGWQPIAWLVELGSSPPQWWTGRGDEWTSYVDGTPSQRGTGADSAIRFARRDDAERAIGWLLDKGIARGCKATEHLWVDAAPRGGPANNE